jgi:hypothetical protein
LGQRAIGVARRERLALVTPASRSAAESWEENSGAELRHQDKGAKNVGSKNRAEEKTTLKKIGRTNPISGASCAAATAYATVKAKLCWEGNNPSHC